MAPASVESSRRGDEMMAMPEWVTSGLGAHHRRFQLSCEGSFGAVHWRPGKEGCSVMYGILFFLLSLLSLLFSSHKADMTQQRWGMSAHIGLGHIGLGL